jgi:hypothetical protein
MKSSSMTRVFPATLVVGLIAGIPLTLFFLWVVGTGSAAPQKPHSVPVAAVGPQPAVAQLAAGLQRGGFTVISTPTEGKAISLVEHRNADAIINLDTRQLQTAPAASTLTAIALQQTFSSPHSPLHLQTVVIKPLGAGDPTGLGLMFIGLTCVLGGIPSGVVLGFLGKSRRPTSLTNAGAQVLLILGFSILAALLIASVADGVLGYGGTQMLAIWGWATFLFAASMAFTTAMIAAFGIAGVLVSALPFLFFGVPSAPAPSPWNWQPLVYRFLGPFDPFGATVNGIRSSVFFGGASQALNLWVLTMWLVFPILVLAALGWRSQLTSRPTAGSPMGARQVAGAERLGGRGAPG